MPISKRVELPIACVHPCYGCLQGPFFMLCFLALGFLFLLALVYACLLHKTMVLYLSSTDGRGRRFLSPEGLLFGAIPAAICGGLIGGFLAGLLWAVLGALIAGIFGGVLGVIVAESLFKCLKASPSP